LYNEHKEVLKAIVLSCTGVLVFIGCLFFIFMPLLAPPPADPIYAPIYDDLKQRHDTAWLIVIIGSFYGAFVIFSTIMTLSLRSLNKKTRRDENKQEKDMNTGHEYWTVDLSLPEHDADGEMDFDGKITCQCDHCRERRGE